MTVICNMTWLCFVIQCLITERTLMVAALLLSDIFRLAFSRKLEVCWLWVREIFNIHTLMRFKIDRPEHLSGYWTRQWPRQRQIQRWLSWIWKLLSVWWQLPISKRTRKVKGPLPWAWGELIIRELFEDIIKTVSPLVCVVDTIHTMWAQSYSVTTFIIHDTWHMTRDTWHVTHLRCACLAEVTTAPRRL